MKTRIGMLQEMGVAIEDAQEYINALEEVLPKFGIANSKVRLAHFFSQILHESGLMRFDTEGLNYSAQRLLAVFPRHFKTLEQAQEFAGNPEKIANKVYANRLGNGSEESGEGWKYRGRGLIQLTGKNNYRAFSEWVEDEAVMDNPGLVASKYAVHSAVFFWDTNNLNEIADEDDVEQLTRKINGGTNGLSHRKELHLKASGLLSMLELGASEA